MNKSKEILLTFDYELFFGPESGTIERCILEPTEKLLHLFKKNNIEGVFFVDVLFYNRLLESSETVSDAMKIRSQLQSIISQGSRIELHLHPHWLDAIYSRGKWAFPHYENYRLHSLSESKIINLFKAGKNTLEEIAREVDPMYRVTAFRAGGFCIQPVGKLMKAFVENNIFIDSSVAPGLYEQNSSRKYDFLSAPDRVGYRFSVDQNSPDIDGYLLELPIATYKINFLAKCFAKLNKIFIKQNSEISGDGIGLAIKRKWWKRYLTETRMITLDGYIPPNVLIRQIQKSKRKVVTIIAHPKSLTSSSFECIEYLAGNGFKFISLEKLTKLFLM